MSAPTPQPARPEKPKSRVGLWVTIAIVAVLAVIAAFVVPKLTQSSDADAKPAGGSEEVTKVKLGVNDIAEAHWEVLVDLAAEENIEVELVSFTDYTTPNPALASGDIDINKFQHVRYLAQHVATQGDDLVPIGSTEIFPISIFSKQWSSIDEIPEGGEVTISNNPANQVRPLLALYNAGLIAFKGEADWNVTIDDIDYEASKLGKVTPIDPSQTAASLDSVDIAFVDTPFQLAAGLGEKETIYREDANRPDLQQYVNVFAVRGEDRDNKALKRVAELYHAPEVQAVITEHPEYDGVEKDETQDDLLKVLAEQIKEFE